MDREEATGQNMKTVQGTSQLWGKGSFWKEIMAINKTSGERGIRHKRKEQTMSKPRREIRLCMFKEMSQVEHGLSTDCKGNGKLVKLKAIRVKNS